MNTGCLQADGGKESRDLCSKPGSELGRTAVLG